MNITVSNNIGFCFGVRRAVDIALKTAEDNQSAVTYGDIIHNPQVVEELKVKGIAAIEDLQDLKTGDKLIICSHGVSPDIYEQCMDKGIEIIDATCPYVKRISQKARYCNENGIQLIIFGEATHPEIVGINGWFSNNAIIINSVEEAEMIEELDKAVIVAQTTADMKLWKKVLVAVENKVDKLEVFDSLCEATMERQKEAEEISKECDMIIVIGGKKSSNTKKLYEVCKKNCPLTFHIEQVSELDEIDFGSAENIGIISGASTPDWIIKEGIKHMSDLNKPTEENDNIEAKEKVDNKVEEKTNIDLVETESPIDAVEAC